MAARTGTEVPGWKKWGALIVFAVQNAGAVLLMRYSKLQHGPAYSNLAAVMMQELVKLGVSTVRPPRPTSAPPHSARPRASDLPPLHPHPHPRRALTLAAPSAAALRQRVPRRGGHGLRPARRPA